MADENLTRAAIRPVKQRVEDELLSRPGVVGVDIDQKVTAGAPTGRLSIVVYVEQKKPAAALGANESIPPEIDGIPTDVQEERIVLHVAFAPAIELSPEVDAKKYSKLHGGIGMGPCRSVHRKPPDVPEEGNYIFVGTLGAIVKDRTTAAVMALTNFHVACVDKGWAVGDTMCQPGRVDHGTCPADVFGTLTRATLSDRVDAAIATVTAGRSTTGTIEEIGKVKGHGEATVGTAVRKRGRTTGLTHGRVTSVDATVSVNYGDGLGNHTLKNQVRIVPDKTQSAAFSAGGDSGSVVVDAETKVVALLFAGSEAATYANPIENVLDELDVDLG